MSGRIKAARSGFVGDAGYIPAMPGTGYVGDPGLFGWIGKKIKGAAGVALGAAAAAGIPGASTIQQYLTRRPPPTMGPPPMTNFPVAPPGFRITSGGTMVRDRTGGQQAVRGRKGGAVVPFGGMPGPPMIAGRGTSFVPDQFGNCPVGHHKNKTGYWITSPQGTPSYVSPGERCVKNRRRNPLNPRATDRAISRLESAKKAVGKIGRVSIRKKCPT